MNEGFRKAEQKAALPLGVRLCNPLNIRKSKSNWIGAVKDGCPGKFVRFQSFFFGWRAAIIIMAKTYYNRGWNTPNSIISHWAPYTENNTSMYAAFVGNYTGLDMNKVMPPLKIGRQKWRLLLIGMAKIEIGYRYVTDEIIKELDSALDQQIENL